MISIIILRLGKQKHRYKIHSSVTTNNTINFIKNTNLHFIHEPDNLHILKRIHFDFLYTSIDIFPSFDYSHTGRKPLEVSKWAYIVGRMHVHMYLGYYS
jgi:hypothetical protein